MTAPTRASAVPVLPLREGVAGVGAPATSVLDDREQTAVEFVRRYTATRGFPPTVREVGQAMGLTSSATAAALIDRLITKGALRRSPGVPRSLVVTNGGGSAQ